MEDYYESVEQWTREDREHVWRMWVWESDCNALPSEECCDMNRMHGWGILCCIREAVRPVDEYEDSVMEIVPNIPVLHIQSEKAICEFSLRELMDQIECMQLNWGQIVALTEDDHGETLLKAVMARVGHIARHAFQTANPEIGYDGVILDDPQHTTCLPRGGMSIISRKSLRQIICILVGLARVQAIVKRAVPIPQYDDKTINANVLSALKVHHVEASMDFFNGLQQMMHLAPGMRLVYRTNFAGMYNDVSQVIYFHYPKYARQPQRSMAELPLHTMNLLPLIRELLPDIPVVYDDDSKIFGLTHMGQQWVWLVSCGTVFLVDGQTGDIYQADNLAGLVCFFVEKTGRRLIISEDVVGDTESEESAARRKRKKRAVDAAFTDHGHVCIIRE